MQDGHHVKRACELLKASRTPFWARRMGRPGLRVVRDAALTQKITEVHEHSHRTRLCGYAVLHGGPAAPVRVEDRLDRRRS